ncbi:4Fe-4S dicluster domain-containing protein [Chryseolinea sp. H1M3-3]|uniref:4Fe-4S binding protein n=1 Tax=Chryseolinea sp. H1M3-3 TaxID=3034144 RepID=UPI0023EB7711|nr:4Fe-4S dicluster domain-containing protein [Chryseolinea sp. H1M3-3]
MKILKITGLLLFVAGFFVFNASFFWADYRLTENAVKKSIHDEQKQALFLTEASAILDRPVSSNFEFIHYVSEIFETINEKQLTKYAITEDELDRLAKLSEATFSIANVDSVFRTSNETSSFKNKVFKDFGGSLESRTFSSPEELHTELKNVSAKVRDYAIINRAGFDRYAQKDIKYSLAKASAESPVRNNPLLYLLLTFGLCIIGAALYILPKIKESKGIKNNNIFFHPMKNVGWLGILTGTWLIVFYVILYFFPEYMTNWIIMVDPISEMLNGHEAGRFFLYGFIYTLCILVMGVRMIIHYRHSKYQIFRTLSVMFFQTAFAFLIPEFLIRLNKPYFDFKNIWPLDYSFFFDFRLDQLRESGALGIFMLGWGIALIIIAVPVFVYFFGKRWYCSWVCGCGGLAETLGDPYRQLSDKSLKAWKIERWMVHGVLAFAIVMTAAVLYTYWTKSSWFLIVDSYSLREVYGSFIGAAFAGVIGTGFYPLMGNRVWCRFGCPLAAYLGLIQRFKSRFRITTNGGQCISCGNCSTYCEMGIDVRWYAQRGQNIVRSSCVGCGVCSAVCPRGVLNLEVKDEEGRFGKPILIGNNNAKLDV